LLGACNRCQTGHEHPGEKDHTGLHCRHHRKPPCRLRSRCSAIVEQILPTSSRATASRVSFCCRMPSDPEPREAFMRYAVSASIAVLAVALASRANAQVGDKPVPMDKAPFHIPVFQNDYLILLNVNIPPGRNTGYHIHYADSVSVNLMPASQ